MTTFDDQKIIDFILGELSEEEASAIEKAALLDSDLRQKIEYNTTFCQQLTDNFKFGQSMELTDLQQARVLKAQKDSKSNSEIPKARRSPWKIYLPILGAAAAVLLVFVQRQEVFEGGIPPKGFPETESFEEIRFKEDMSGGANFGQTSIEVKSKENIVPKKAKSADKLKGKRDSTSRLVESSPAARKKSLQPKFEFEVVPTQKAPVFEENTPELSKVPSAASITGIASHSDTNGYISYGVKASLKNFTPNDKQRIKVFIKSKLKEFTLCYKELLERSPSIAGRIDILFAIKGDGVVEKAEIVKSHLDDKVFLDCVVKKAQSWHYPVPKAGEPAVFTIPFTFTPVES